MVKINDKLNLTPTSAPATPVEGDLYYDSTAKGLKVHDGTAFKSTGATVDNVTTDINSNNEIEVISLYKQYVNTQDIFLSGDTTVHSNSGTSALKISTMTISKDVIGLKVGVALNHSLSFGRSSVSIRKNGTYIYSVSIGYSGSTYSPATVITDVVAGDIIEFYISSSDGGVGYGVSARDIGVYGEEIITYKSKIAYTQV